MTTLVWYDGVLAAERRCSLYGAQMNTEEQKLFKWVEQKRNGGSPGLVTFYVALGGSAALIQQVLNWLVSGANMREIPNKDFMGILVRKETRSNWAKEDVRVFEIDQDGIHHVPTDIPVALGSGHAFAMGALHAGADAYQAVEIAGTLDGNSNTNISSVNIYNGTENRVHHVDVIAVGDVFYPTNTHHKEPKNG